MIRAEGFTFQYPTQNTAALSDLSFEIDEGEVLGVVGPVEAGKTTLAMALASFAPQNTGGTTEGTLSVASRDPREAEDNRVAMAFEDYSSQLTQVRVIDEVIAPLVNRGFSRATAADRARELLDQVRLDGVDETKFTWELSGGQQQRLAIAAALAIDPEVMIFDTATDMLDPEGREDVANLIASLKGDKTLVVTENDPDVLVGLADRLLVLEDGEQVTFGPADDLLRNADLLEGVGVAPPVCVRIARQVGLPGPPLSLGEFVDTIDSHTSLQRGSDGRASGGDEEDHTAAHPEFGEELLSADSIGHDGAVEGETVSELGEPLLRAEDVRYEYSSDAVAVEDVAFSVREGEVHALIGGNGAGKSTFSKLLVGLFDPDEGRMLVKGEPTDDRPAREVAESVGITLQNPDEQLSEQTVEKEIRFPLEKRQYERSGFLGLSKRERYDEAFIE
ncbi:MAG: ATP-binding cassette domain-containing protein, partial [Halobacteriales archaeon]